MSLLHVTNGDGARLPIEALGLAGTVIVWRDVLHEGPVPAGLGATELREVRARFLAGADWSWVRLEEARRELAQRDAALGASAAHDEVVLWFEHDLYDQLQLMQVLDQAPRGARLSLAQSPEYLGELTAQGLLRVWEGREPVSETQRAVARDGWSAFRSSDPRAIERFVSGNTSALPYLAPALRRQLEEYPGTDDGLARSERQLLEAVAAGRAEPADAFLAAQEREEAVFMGDAVAFDRLAGLARGPVPLLAGAPYRLTAAGEAVLAGNADRIELAGIDRWLGGVRLEGKRVWRWDRATRRLAPP